LKILREKIPKNIFSREMLLSLIYESWSPTFSRFCVLSRSSASACGPIANLSFEAVAMSAYDPKQTSGRLFTHRHGRQIEAITELCKKFGC
jgi:hypothetical protein